MSKAPLVSVIIPAFNEENVIGRLLQSLKKQSYSRVEIIVVDDSSIDNTAQVAGKFTRNVYTRKHAERSVQRNFGVRKSKGKYLLILDADMELTKDVIKDCVGACIKEKEIGEVVIPEESVSENFWGKVKAFERSFYNQNGDESTDAARFFSREAFERVGGYDETITGPEDWDLPESIEKKGYKKERISSKLFHYERIPGLLKLATKKYYYGLKTHRYLEKQKISPISSKTVYFLRPVFYRNWRKLLEHPVLSAAMFVMFLFELVGGGMGYLVGKHILKT